MLSKWKKSTITPRSNVLRKIVRLKRSLLLQMESEKNTILFTLVYQNKRYPVQTRRNQYHTLMTLISDHLSLFDFGLCCGMGSCGTCLVGIKEKHSPLERFALSCEMHVNDELSNTQITIIDDK
jgi:hypothetical protein